MSHQLTKEVKTRLAEFAAAITPPAAGPGKARPTADVYAAVLAPAVNHERRLLAKYEAGGWPAVELYLQPFLTPAGYARQLMERAADARAAAADAAPADFQPRVEPAPTAWLEEASALVGTGEPGPFGPLPAGDEHGGLRTCEPRPLEEQLQAGADAFRQIVAEHRAAGTLPEAPAVLMPLRPYDAGTEFPLVAEFFSAGLEGPISPAAECLLAQSAAAVDAHLQAWVPEVEVREFIKLGQRWEREADEQLQLHRRNQLYEAGHPGPMGECPAARQCAGACGACLNQ